MQVAPKLQISKSFKVRQIYAKRYQLTYSLVIVRKSTGVNLGKIGRCFQKNQAFTTPMVRACSFWLKKTTSRWF